MNTHALCFEDSTRPRQQGFTLIEMLVVIAILVLLASLLAAGAGRSMERARQTACANNQKNIHAAFLNYAAEREGLLPPVCNIADGWRIWAYYLIPYSGEESLKPYGPDRSGSPPSSQAPRSIFVCPSFSKEFPGKTLERNFLGGYGMNRRLPPSETKDEDFANAIGGNDWVAQYQSRGSLESIRDASQRILVACGDGLNGDLETYWQASNPKDASFSKKRHNKGANILYVDGHVSSLSGDDIVLHATNEKGQHGSKKRPMLFRSGNF